MLRPALLLTASLLSVPAHAVSPAVADSGERLAGVLERVEGAFSSANALDRLFDGSGAPGSAGGVSAASLDAGQLERVKDLLGHGAPDGAPPIEPFVFNLDGGGRSEAQSAGLEGFVYQEAELAHARGRAALLRNLPDYFLYLDALLAAQGWAVNTRAKLAELKAAPLPDAEKYDKVLTLVREFTAALRTEVAASDKSAWVRKARIYELFPRAFNLAGRREAYGTRSAGRFFADFTTSDMLAIKAMGFDTLWPMGIFPIGQRNQSGTGGGSPYSIQDHEALNPELGTEEEFRAFVQRAHAAGLRVIIDFVPNHTAMDSKLLMTHPEWFVHRDAGAGPAPGGYFEHADPKTGRKYWIAHGGYEMNGSVAPWIDTAQIDYSDPGMRAEMTRIVRSWVTRFGVDGFRVDMAYIVLNRNFARSWHKAMPPGEFLAQLISTARGAAPATAFIAEAYDDWDSLSRTGFDLAYGKNDMGRPGGHVGWYDALQSRDPGRIGAALRRAAFLDWQTGGMGMLEFIGNHDEASPKRAFGPWMYGASHLTLLLPGNLLFYGSQETGFDAYDPREPKSIPFCVPVVVDWKKGDPEAKRFYDTAFVEARRVRAELGASDLIALDGAGDGWAGYLLASRTNGRKVVVVANPSDRWVHVKVDRPEYGLQIDRWYSPLDYGVIRP